MSHGYMQYPSEEGLPTASFELSRKSGDWKWSRNKSSFHRPSK
jgi:hypothetical protein